MYILINLHGKLSECRSLYDNLLRSKYDSKLLVTIA